MYGLEGKMINYEAHTCKTLKQTTNNNSHNYNINCPFVNKTNFEFIKSLLNEYHGNDLTNDCINRIVNSNNKCYTYFEILANKNCSTKDTNNLQEYLLKPSNFYNYLTRKKN